MIFTEIEEDSLNEVLSDQKIISKCDCMILLYENDYDQIEFLKKITSRLPELVPKIVVRTKMDIKNNEPLEST